MDRTARPFIGILNPHALPIYSVAGMLLASATAYFCWSDGADGGVILPEPFGFEATGQDRNAYTHADVCFPSTMCPAVTVEAKDSSPCATREADDEFLRGRFYTSKSELDPAVAHFSKTIQLDPKSAKAYIARGELHLARGDHRKAMQDFSQAVELSPTLAAAHTALGHGHLANKEWKRAIAELTRAVELNRRDYAAYAARAYAYLRTGDQANAFADHDKALQLIEHEYVELVHVVQPYPLKWRLPDGGPIDGGLFEGDRSRFPPHFVPAEIDEGMLLDAWQRRHSLPGYNEHR